LRHALKLSAPALSKSPVFEALSSLNQSSQLASQKRTSHNQPQKKSGRNQSSQLSRKATKP
jgi:hypothetical protein